MSFQLTEKGHYVRIYILAHGGSVGSILTIKDTALALGVGLDEAVAWTKERITVKKCTSGFETHLTVSPSLRFEVLARSRKEALKLLCRTMSAAAR